MLSGTPCNWFDTGVTLKNERLAFASWICTRKSPVLRATANTQRKSEFRIEMLAVALPKAVRLNVNAYVSSRPGTGMVPEPPHMGQTCAWLPTATILLPLHAGHGCFVAGVAIRTSLIRIRKIGTACTERVKMLG